MQKKSFMVDTNVFIAAFKSGYTTTTKLLQKLLSDPNVNLVVDDILLKEYEKWFEILALKIPEIKEQAKLLFSIIKAKAKLQIPDRESIERVKPYLPEGELADIYHAATCLKTNSILITNDKDFQDLQKAGIIKIWSISDAIKEIL